MGKINWAALAAGTLLLAAAAEVNAATATSTFQVSATVAKTCSVTATAVAFGNFTPGGGALTNAASAVNVNCTKGTTYTIALNPGTTAGGTVAQRLLANGANTLQYNLYTTNAYSSVWGDGTGTSVTQAGTGNGLGVAASALTLYSQLPDNATNQVAPPGAYTDTVTVTVTY